MRILLVTHRFPPEGLAGVERYTASLARELTRRGHSVAVVTRRNDPHNPFIRIDRADEEDLIVYALTGEHHGLDRFLANSRRVELLFRRVLIEFAPEVVHVNHLLYLSPGLLHLAHKYGAAVVLTLHDFYFACPLAHLRKTNGQLCSGPERGEECAATCFSYESAAGSQRWTKRFELFRDLLEVPEVVVAPSEYVRRFYHQQGVRREIETIAHGLPVTPGRAPRREPGSELTLAYIGALTPHKGPHTIVTAIGRAEPESCELRIIGTSEDPTYRQELRRQAMRVPNLRVRFHDRYEPQELPHLLADVDAVVIPSLVPETFSFCAREALACGIPILVSDLGVLPEAVAEGKNGFVFRTTEELSLLVRQLGRDPALRAALREGAWRTEIPSFATHTSALEAQYARARDAYAAAPGRRAARDRSIRNAQRELEELSEAPPFLVSGSA